MYSWLVVLRIYVALAVFQPYRDLEAGDNQPLKYKWRGRESNPGPLALQAKSLTTRPPLLPIYMYSTGFDEHTCCSGTYDGKVWLPLKGDYLKVLLKDRRMLDKVIPTHFSTKCTQHSMIVFDVMFNSAKFRSKFVTAFHIDWLFSLIKGNYIYYWMVISLTSLVRLLGRDWPSRDRPSHCNVKRSIMKFFLSIWLIKFCIMKWARYSNYI